MRAYPRLVVSLRYGLLLAAVAACGGESVIPDPLEDEELYWALTLNHQAVTLSTSAPWDTLQLVATPRNPYGEPLAGLSAPTFLSRVPEGVVVDGDGRLHAVTPQAEPVWVVARLQGGNVTHTDSMRVRVVDDGAPPALGELSIQPMPPDSAKRPAGIGVGTLLSTFFLPLRVETAGGDALPIYPLTDAAQVIVSFRSSDTTIAIVHHATGEVLMTRVPGDVAFYASATAFGVTRVDTLRYRVGPRLASMVQVIKTVTTADGLPVPTPFPTEITVGVGGLVTWSSLTLNDEPFESDVVFDDPTAGSAVDSYAPWLFERWNLFGNPLSVFCAFGLVDCTGRGNGVVDNPDLPLLMRVFHTPGTYHYTLSATGARGRVVVVAE